MGGACVGQPARLCQRAPLAVSGRSANPNPNPKLTLSLSLSLTLTNLSPSLGGRPRDRLGRQLHAVHSAQVVLLACMQKSAHTTGYSAPKAVALCPLASAGLHAV